MLITRPSIGLTNQNTCQGLSLTQVSYMLGQTPQWIAQASQWKLRSVQCRALQRPSEADETLGLSAFGLALFASRLG